jgi:xanthine dehydrogenase accessory factor
MPFALATVVATEGSSPREVGSVMAIDPAGPRFIGSVSSGCLEVEVIEAAQTVLRAERARYFHFGPEGTPVWNDGLTCGGRVRVRLEPWWGLLNAGIFLPVVSALRDWIKQDQSGLILSKGNEHLAITRTHVMGSTAGWSNEVLDQAAKQLSLEMPPCELELNGETVFCRSVLRRPRLLIVGAGEVTLKLVQLARVLGWKTLVVDPRAAYLNAERFDIQPDELIGAWPQNVVSQFDLGPRDAGLVLTHDAKIDDPALSALLTSRVGYIGAMGSRQSHQARIKRLQQDTLDAESIGRIQSPCGIHLGSASALGIATGIFAGLTQWQHAARLATNHRVP